MIPTTPIRDHDWAQESIPWLVNGTLTDAEAQRLRDHLERCDQCRMDLRREEQFARAIATRTAIDYAPQASLAKMLKRLDSPARFSFRGWVAHWRDQASKGRRSSLVLFFGAQAAAVVLLTLVLAWQVWQPEPAKTYVPTSAPSVSLPHLQVIFDEQASASEILGIVAEVNGRVIGGPSSAGVYLLAVDGRPINSAAQFLQRHPRVRFVAVVRAP